MPELVDKIITFETVGFGTDEEVISFVQELIDTGLAWSLQGSYARLANELIDAGYCTRGDK